MCCLDILNDMLKRFGSLMLGELDKIQKAVLPQLTSGRPATRKRAISCLGTPFILFYYYFLLFYIHSVWLIKLTLK